MTTKTTFTMLINDEQKLLVDIFQEHWEDEQLKEAQCVRLGLEHFALLVEKVNAKAADIQKTLNSQQKFDNHEKSN